MTTTIDNAVRVEPVPPAGPRWRLRALLAVVGLVVLLLVGASVSAMAWGSGLRDAQQLLPGTIIASVDVGGQTVDEATAAVEDHLAPRLDRTVTVTHDDASWEITPRDLGATIDARGAVEAAYVRTEEAGFAELLRHRWAGGRQAAEDVVVPIELDPDAATAFVAGTADDVDRDPVDAQLAWSDDAFELTEAIDGLRVERDVAEQALADAIVAGDETVALPVEVTAPDVTTDRAEDVAADVTAAIDEALDRTVTVTVEDTSREVTARELGAAPDAAALVDAAYEGDAPSVDAVALSVGDDALRGVVDDVAGGHEVSSRNAEIAFGGGSFDITPERTGLAVPRGDAIDQLRAALADGTDAVTFELVTTRPAITADSFDQVLVVDHSDRRVYLYRGDQVVRDWPVAIGAASSPTPKGQFVIGAMRNAPTWVNPSPNGWGKDMPARIGPGPDNPLGVRALNWNTLAGADTLIRFHGTPNEGSIGSATSNGCVRMFNSDVTELFGMVSTGTTVLSVS